MKEYDKLAHKWITEELGGGHSEIRQKAFVAGFLKALEMAASNILASDGLFDYVTLAEATLKLGKKEV